MIKIRKVVVYIDYVELLDNLTESSTEVLAKFNMWLRWFLLWAVVFPTAIIIGWHWLIVALAFCLIPLSVLYPDQSCATLPYLHCMDLIKRLAAMRYCAKKHDGEPFKVLCNMPYVYDCYDQWQLLETLENNKCRVVFDPLSKTLTVSEESGRVWDFEISKLTMDSDISKWCESEYVLTITLDYNYVTDAELTYTDNAAEVSHTDRVISW